MKDQIVLIDGKNVALANYFTHRSLCVQNGKRKGFPTGLIHGVLMSLLRLSRKFDKSPLVICWDGQGKSWRSVEYPAYKAHRQRDEKVVTDVSLQLKVLETLLDDLQIPQLRLANVEADDLIGILSKMLQQDFNRIVIRSTDQDFYQLLSEKVILYKEYPKSEIVTAGSVRREFGVEPKDWCQLRAMSGDTTDNLIGLPKVGLLTAARLFAAGVRVPIKNGNQPRVKVTRFSTDNLTANDWQRINQTYRLSKILTDLYDSRLTEDMRFRIASFVNTMRGCGFTRTKQINEWYVLGRLGEYELNEAQMSIADLERIY